jgi:pimeloyl-ACP methyl ester carboxylesterase
MTLEQHQWFYESEQGRICVRQWGRGERLIIALHGFAATGASFRPLAAALPPDCTLIAPDLPFHGQTAWAPPQFTLAHINQLLHYLWEKMGCRPFALIGHSLGGRLAIACLPHQEGRVNSLYLLAPDGLDNPYGFWQDRLPVSVRKGLQAMARHPRGIVRLATLLHRLRILDSFALRYVQHHLATPQHQERLFKTWQSLVYFTCTTKEMEACLSRNGVPVRCYFGNRDRLCRGETCQQLAEKLPNVRTYELDAGHQLIQPATENIVATFLP